MSALTDQQIQSLIVLEVGDVVTPSAPSGILTTNIALIWQSYQDKRQIWPRLQELYSKRRCLDIVLGVRREQVDRAADTIRENLSQIAAELEKMRAACQQEIARVEALAAANRGGVVAAIVQTTIETPPTGAVVSDIINANDPVYQGDPYRPITRVQG